MNSIAKPTFIDLFAGIGGFRMGFNQAGFECVFSSEINPACQYVYQQNFADPVWSDVQTIDIAQLKPFSVLVAGFPCQPFSICGKRKGFEDTRGTLFFDICRIADEKKPSILVLENVKHLLHHDGGSTLEVIVRSLEDLGYFVSYQLLNAKDFGVPQNRERVIIIAARNACFDFKKIRKTAPVPLIDFLDQDGDFEYLSPDEYTLLEDYKVQESGLIFIGYRNKNIWKKGIRPNTEHLSRVHRQPNRIYSVEGTHPTLPSQESSGRFFIYIPQENAVRKLTINECYRIMGFPATFKRHHSLAECYKQIGNSVCVPMIQEIAQQLILQGLFNDATQPPKRTRTAYQQLSLIE